MEMETQVEINAYVSSFSVRDVSDSVVFYDLAVTHIPLARRWQVHRRYREFEALREALSQFFAELPSLPPKSLWRRADAEFLTQRKMKLDEFVRSTVKRTELSRCSVLRDFLEVSRFAPEAVPPALQVLCQSYTDTPIHRATAAGRCLISISLSSAGTDPSLSFFSRAGRCHPYAQLWTQRVLPNPTSVSWDSQLTLLAVGYDAGLVEVFRVYTELECQKYEIFARFQPHNDAIVSLATNYRNSHLYSLASNRRFVVTDINSTESLLEIGLKEPPKALAFVPNCSRLYVATKHQVLFFDTETLSLTATVEPKTKAQFTVVTSLSEVSRLFAGTTDGRIVVFRLGMLDCEQTSHEETVWRWKGTVTSMSCSSFRHEVYVGNSEGLLGVWDARTLQLLTVIRADTTAVIEVMETEEGLVAIGAGERVIRNFAAPERWGVAVDEEARTETAITETWKVTEDDLSGWDR